MPAMNKNINHKTFCRQSGLTGRECTRQDKLFKIFNHRKHIWSPSKKIARIFGSSLYLKTVKKRFECMNGRKRKCHEGFYNPKMNQRCEKCDRANKCPIKGMLEPIPCPIGKYQTRLKKTFCIDCPDKKRCNETELLRPQNCPRGKLLVRF